MHSRKFFDINFETKYTPFVAYCILYGKQNFARHTKLDTQ